MCSCCACLWLLPCCLRGSLWSPKNQLTASKWHHRSDPRQNYSKAGCNIWRWQTDKQQSILRSAAIWPWLTSSSSDIAFPIRSLSLQAPPCVLAHFFIRLIMETCFNTCISHRNTSYSSMYYRPYGAMAVSFLRNKHFLSDWASSCS